jgi:TetR/AcrR family transcriptional repressor of nem operon
MAALPESFRALLNAVFDDWERRLARCLEAAQRDGQIPAAVDCTQQASFFWIGWEGAVLRAKLERSAKPLDIFARGFFTGLQWA